MPGRVEAGDPAEAREPTHLPPRQESVPTRVELIPRNDLRATRAPLAHQQHTERMFAMASPSAGESDHQALQREFRWYPPRALEGEVGLVNRSEARE